MGSRMTDRLARVQCNFDAGEDIISEGEPSTEVFVLLKGRARVHTGDHEIRVLEVDSGDLFFGELATLLGRPRTATVTALTPCTVLKIPGDTLMDVLTSCPRLLSALLQQMASRTVYMDEVRRQVKQARSQVAA